MLKVNSLILISILTNIFILIPHSKTKEILTLGAIPDQNPENLNRLYKTLTSELSNSLNIEVKYKPVTNYAAAVTAFRTGDLDLVWFGGLTGTQARLQKKGAKVLTSLSNSVDILVVGESPGSKLKKATALGIKTVNEHEFLDLVSQRKIDQS